MEAAAHRWSGPADLELDSPVVAPVPLPPGVAAHEAWKKADGCWWRLSRRKSMNPKSEIVELMYRRKSNQSQSTYTLFYTIFFGNKEQHLNFGNPAGAPQAVRLVVPPFTSLKSSNRCGLLEKAGELRLNEANLSRFQNGGSLRGLHQHLQNHVGR